MKKCDRLQAYIDDDAFKGKHLIENIEDIASGSFLTSDSNYQLAKKGIESGEESYTENN